MNILLHTIALEPARWTPQRVSRPLVDLLPSIAEAGFRKVEVFEPHLAGKDGPAEIKEAFARCGLRPVILSSYLSLNPADTTDADLGMKISALARCVEGYGFEKVRLFPGPKMNPADGESVATFKARLSQLVDLMPEVEILLETHDGSLADDPEVVTEIVRDLGHPRVGLLFQPTFFQDKDSILEQFRIEKPFIRHIHLQNRMPDLSFVAMKEGIIPWPELLRELDGGIDATLEFVPVGVCPPDQFDLEATLEQVRSEVDYIRTLVPERS